MRAAGFLRAGLPVLLGLAGCGGAGSDPSPPNAALDQSASPAGPEQAAPPDADNETAPAAAAETKGGAAPVDSVAPEDRSGPSRRARCRLDDEPAQPCRFTPLFGDGSFNVEIEPDREYRLVIDGERGHLFVVFGPQHRVPMAQGYRRDRDDRACWVADEPGLVPDRICVY